MSRAVKQLQDLSLKANEELAKLQYDVAQAEAVFERAKAALAERMALIAECDEALTVLDAAAKATPGRVQP